MNKHECFVFCTSDMIDVTTRNDGKSIHCRRCGEKLKESQVDKETLNKLNWRKKQWNKTTHGQGSAVNI